MAGEHRGGDLGPIGRLAAEEIASGTVDPRLEPFRADRFERGELLAASKGPYPWT